METRTFSDNFKVEIMKRGIVRPVRGFRLPAHIASLGEIERVSMLQPVPYAGDERPMIHVRKSVSKFMLEKPA